jgi:hypothetical protein
MWLFSALWLYDATWGTASHAVESNIQTPWFTRRRRIGAAVGLAGAAIWLLGFEYAAVDAWWEFLVLVGSSTAALLGAANLVFE